MSQQSRRSGFTLIELVITITIIALVAGVYFLSANPGGQLAQARNGRRSTDLQTLILAIRENVADQGNGQFGCSSGSLPTSSENMGSATGSYNIAPCLIPIYLPVLPVDPSASSSYFTSVSNYSTGYSIVLNASGSITLSAPSAELRQVITVTR